MSRSKNYMDDDGDSWMFSYSKYCGNLLGKCSRQELPFILANGLDQLAKHTIELGLDKKYMISLGLLISRLEGWIYEDKNERKKPIFSHLVEDDNKLFKEVEEILTNRYNYY